MLNESYFTVADVAKTLKVSEATVTNWIEKDALFAIDTAGVGAKIRQWRIPQSGIDVFITARKNSAKLPSRSGQVAKLPKRMAKKRHF